MRLALPPISFTAPFGVSSLTDAVMRMTRTKMN